MSPETPRRIEARRGFSILYKGKTLLSRIDPIGQAEKAAGGLHHTGRTLYFCPSPLFGYGLSRVLENASPDSALLCVEADEELMKFSLREMDKELLLDPRVRLIRTEEPRALAEYVHGQWGARAFRRVEVLRLGGGWQLYPETYAGLIGFLRRTIALDWGNAVTLIALGRRYVRNAVRNLALIPSSEPLPDFGDCPVLTLGAGPSLDAVLDWLASFSGGELFRGNSARPYRIIIVDTALRSLRDRGLEPDLVVALEAQHYNLRDFVGSRGWPVPLAMDLSALPATAGMLGPPRLFFTPWTNLRIFGRMEKSGILPPQFPPLGSVGLSAAALALRLTKGPVVTGGLDFSFLPGGAFHAKSAPGSLERLEKHGRFGGFAGAVRPGTLRLRAKNTAVVSSDPALKKYRDLFEEEFGGEKRVYDLETAGLPLGVPVVSFDEGRELLLGDRAASNAISRAATSCAETSRGEQAPPAGTTPGALPPAGNGLYERTAGFVKNELELARRLRDLLSGKASASGAETEAGLGRLLDECDYLWAHFPECAGKEGKRPGTGDLSFLKRVRVEIDPFLGLFELTLAELRLSAAR